MFMVRTLNYENSYLSGKLFQQMQMSKNVTFASLFPFINKFTLNTVQTISIYQNMVYTNHGIKYMDKIIF